MHHVRRRALLLSTALLCLLTVAPLVGTAVAREGDDAVAVLHLNGRGHGHGVGLSQWGAYTMAANGASATDIIGQFYPGTSIGTAAGEVVVVVDTRERVVVQLPQGGQLRSARDGAQARGFPVQLEPGEMAEIVHDGSGYRVTRGGVRPMSAGEPQRFGAAQQDCLVLCDPEDPDDEPEPDDGEGDGGGPCVLCTTTTTAPGPGGPGEPTPGEPAPGEPAPSPGQPAPSTTAASGPVSPTPVWAIPNGGGTVTSVDRGRTYRGSFEIVGGPGELRVRNHVDVEHYLRGMAEVPGDWPAAAVQAQAVAARTYALRAVAASGEICDSEACQVYVGVSRETPGQVAAVEATRGWVVQYGGGLAATFYSASGGGHSATVQEGFGATYDIPYLPARPYETANPKRWQLDLALADVADRLGYPGTLTDVRVTARGPSGRPVAMELVGDAGAAAVGPQDFRRQLGLQSTLFEVSTSLSEQAPPPPPPPVENDQLTTAAGDQLSALGGSRAALDPALEPSVDPGRRPVRALAGPPSDRTAGDPGVERLLLFLTVLGAALTSARLHRVGATTVADGLGGSVLGAPATGLPRRAAATMTPWTSRSP